MTSRGVVGTLLSLALLSSGCATAHYNPRITARGELTLEYESGFRMNAAGRRVASAPVWSGLSEYVRCVPRARDLAERARAQGRTGQATSILGAAFGMLALGGLYGVAADETAVRWGFLGGGLGSAFIGLAFAGVSVAERNGANGRAIDAMNYYNDAVGSLGATCDDLTYPYPIGPTPPAAP